MIPTWRCPSETRPSSLDEMGETARAAEYNERALEIMEGTLVLDHPKAAIPLTNLGRLLNDLGRFEEARGRAGRALAVFERGDDPDGVYVTYPLTSIRLSYIGVGSYGDAVPPLERAVRIRKAKGERSCQTG